MADITTNTLKIGDNNLILRDADAQAKLTTNTQNITQLQTDTNQLKEEYSDILNSAYVTDTASGAIASFPDGADGVPVKSLKVNVEPVQSGSGDPSPTNVRPISGHTSAVVTRTGKNLIADTIINGQIGSSGGFSSASNRITNADAESTPVLSTTWLKAGKYTLSCSGLNSCSVLSKDSSGNIIDNFATSLHDLPYTFTLTKEAYVMFTARKSDNSNLTPSDYHPQIEVGESASTYEAYTANTYTIDLNGTRYGGTLNVETGVLTVDSTIITLDGSNDENWAASGSKFYSTAVLGCKTDGDAISNEYKYSGNSAGSTTVLVDKSFYLQPINNRIWVYDTGYSDLATFKTALGSNPLVVVYELAEPLTVQLTANDIKTLLGTNNIWSDAGDVKVDYRADTKLYIEKLTAPTEDDMIADHAISANSFFMVGNTLYRATTAIASGATITVGTNATRLSLADALNTLS